MDVIGWFGREVSTQAAADGARARRLLIAGYRADTLALRLGLDGQGPRVRRYGQRIVMDVVVDALAHPHRSALVSLFVPCELLTAAGITPYSLEAISGYLMGTGCAGPFQQQAGCDGCAETMCSFHRTFWGAADAGLLPKPRFIIYTNLACDGNMVTFHHLAASYGVPSFFIEVPYRRSEKAVADVASQLRDLAGFIAAQTGQPIDYGRLTQAVERSRSSIAAYGAYLDQTGRRWVPSDVTAEMYGVFASHLLLGSETGRRYWQGLADEVQRQPDDGAIRLLWVHAIPYMQPGLRQVIHCGGSVRITACDLCYDSMLDRGLDDDPYMFMARRMVYSGFNGDPDLRIANALAMARRTAAQGIVIFNHAGCKSTLGASQLMRRAFEQAGLPTLVLDGDACCPANTGDGQLKTRLQAFVEMLEARR